MNGRPETGSREVVRRLPGTSPAVSVIVVSYNTRDLLMQCLQTLQSCEGSFEVIVVDNASADGSADMVAGNFPDVQLIRNPVGRFFAPAANQGLEVSRGTHGVLLLNSDIKVEPSTIKELMAGLDGSIVATVPLIVGMDGAVQGEYTFRRLPRVRDLILNLLFWRRIVGMLPFSRSRGDRIAKRAGASDVEQPSGACMMIRADVLRSIGGLDESLKLWFNDVDLCRQLRARHVRVRCLHGMRVIHAGGASIQTMTEADRTQRLYADTLGYTRKWHPRWVGVVRAFVVLNWGLRAAAKIFKPRELRAWIGEAGRVMGDGAA